MIRIIYTLLFLLFILSVEAQVTGKVTEANGDPVMGAVIRLNGSDIGTVTDVDGFYTIDATEGTLVFSFTGMADVREEINSRSVIDVVMEVSAVGT
jgi:iron complex outermembrane receptor protein